MYRGDNIHGVPNFGEPLPTVNYLRDTHGTFIPSSLIMGTAVGLRPRWAAATSSRPHGGARRHPAPRLVAWASAHRERVCVRPGAAELLIDVEYSRIRYNTSIYLTIL